MGSWSNWMKAVQTLSSHIQRGSVLLMTLVYTLLFGALAAAMVAYSMGNMRVGMAEMQANRALAAAESGMSYLLAQFRPANMPVLDKGSIHLMTTPTTLWAGTNVDGISGNDGIARRLAASINKCGAFVTGGAQASIPTGTSSLIVPPISVDRTADDSSFSLTVQWNPVNPVEVKDASGNTTTSYILLHLISVGKAGNVSRSVAMDIRLQKTFKYAVYSNVAIQIGKNVRVFGDVASAYNGTGKGPPVQLFSDWHYLPNKTALDTDLGTLRTLLATYDSASKDGKQDNRLDVRDANSAAAKAAAQKYLTDRNGDGFIDDYDIALKNLDTNYLSSDPSASNLTTTEFNNSRTGQLYDADLWTLIDVPLGAGADPRPGYNDRVIDNKDGYAKINGSVKMALSESSWNSALGGWSAWGDSGSTRTQDMLEGPIVPTDPAAKAIEFGVNFEDNELSLTPQDFNTSGFDSKIPSTTATKTTSGGVTTISNGTLTASQANGSTVTEHFPASVSSGWQATYSRPVFQNVTFNNVRIPKGLNAKFVNCKFNGYTHVDMTTKIVDPTDSSKNTNSDGSTSNPDSGMKWSQKMLSGSFSADTTLTSSNSNGYREGNNLHFTDCTFSGVLTADTPSAYTHFGNSMEFDGKTVINNQIDQSVTIMAPNTNIEIGGYVDPTGNASTLVGVVVAGNIDIRGTATVDGSLIVTGNGAGNTTLGYFGTTDSGQAVPTLSQLPSSADGKYGHLYFRYNPNRGMPNGIQIPLTAVPQFDTYQIQ